MRMLSVICRRHRHAIAMKLGGGECVCSPAECLSPPAASAEIPALCGIEPAYRAACSDYHELGCTADHCVMGGGKCEHPQRYRVRAALAAALAATGEVVQAIAVERCLREQRRHRKRLEDQLRSPYEETAPGCRLWMRWSDEVRGDLAALRQLFLGPAE